jgi:hypothetical protein
MKHFNTYRLKKRANHQKKVMALKLKLIKQKQDLPLKRKHWVSVLLFKKQARIFKSVRKSRSSLDACPYIPELII